MPAGRDWLAEVKDYERDVLSCAELVGPGGSSATVAGVDRDQQGVRRCSGAQGGFVRPAGRRGSRLGRRERRGEINADQGDHRRRTCPTGEDRGRRPGGRDLDPVAVRGRWGSPRFTSSRRSFRPDGRREHRDRPGAGRLVATGALGLAPRSVRDLLDKDRRDDRPGDGSPRRCRCPSSNWWRSHGPWGPKRGF